MTAKNKGEFLFELHNELHRIGIDADEEIFADFEEHFKEGMEQGISEEETCRRLGDPKEIARNYFEIRSSRINSIVADAIEADRPHVSLTKPGRNQPADISLSQPAQPAQPEPIREVTPEHIITEEEAAAQAAASRAQSAPIREVTPEHIAAEPSPSKPSDILGSLIDERKASQPEQPLNEVTPEHIAAEPDPNQASQPEQSIPTPSSDHEKNHNNDRTGYVPPQSCKPVGDNGGRLDWSQIKGRQANINATKLFIALLLDVVLYSWLIPLLFSLGIGIACGGIGVIGSGVGALFGGTFVFVSRIALTVALVSLGCIMILGGACIIKGAVKLIIRIVENHVKAVFDL